MEASIGFHFIEPTNRDERSHSILNLLNSAGLIVDGNRIELVYETDNGQDVCRVWVEGTMEAFHNAADLLISINNGGPVMFVVRDLTVAQVAEMQEVLESNSIEQDVLPEADGEIFAFCGCADHIRIIANNLE